METERELSVNVAQNITDKYFVSTAMWATGISATGMHHPTYEMFIWEWDSIKKQRGKMMKQYYFESRPKAINYHFRFCRTLAWNQLKRKIENDRPFIFQNI